MNPNRREFLERILVPSLALTLPIIANSESNSFKLDYNSIPIGSIYWGTNQDEYFSPAFVLRNLLIQNTPEYKEINSRTGEAAKQIKLSEASDRASKWVMDYSKKNRHDLVLERAFFLKNSPFTEIPESLKKYTPEEIMDYLDITTAIINEYKK